MVRRVGLSMDERIAELYEHTLAWDIHAGDKYKASSKLGLNDVFAGKMGPDGPSGRTVMPYQDTGHDLLDVAEFRDFMDARVEQCQALMENIGLYRVLLQDYPELKDSSVLFGPEHRMEESWTMARYGVNEGKHHSEFEAQAGRDGERPYDTSRSRFAAALRAEDDAPIRALCDSMSRFCDTWNTVKLSEDSKMLRFQRGLEGSTAWIGPEDGSSRQRVASQDFLQYMAAENLGREGYYSRAASIYDSFEPRGVKAAGIDVNQDFMAKLRDVCENLSPDAKIGRGFGNIRPYAMDGGSLVRQVRYEMDLEHRAEMDMAREQQLNAELATASDFDAKTAARYIGDLEAACADMSQPSDELDGSELM